MTRRSSEMICRFVCFDVKHSSDIISSSILLCLDNLYRNL